MFGIHRMKAAGRQRRQHGNDAQPRYEARTEGISVPIDSEQAPGF
jgi:hypothetical protein